MNDYKGFEHISEFTTALGNKWGIGLAEKENGLMIVINVLKQEARIGTGKGTEKILTDEVCDDMMQNHMLPNFRDGKFFEGVWSLLKEIEKRWVEVQ